MNPRPVSTTYEVPGSKWVNLNGSHGHPRAHQGSMNEWKDRAAIAIRAAGCTPLDAPVTITATVHRVTNAKADSHNVTPSIKACIDAAVECGLIPDDNDDIVTRLVIERGEKRPKPTITIRIDCA